MTASSSGQRGVPANGWDARLYWLWIWYNSIAFVTVLTIGFLLTLLGSDVLHLTLASRHVLVGLVIATLGAVLFGGVLGALQWLVVQERVPVPRRRWIVANIGPALLAWLLVILPAVINAQNSQEEASTAYLLAASQALAGSAAWVVAVAGASQGHQPLGLVDRGQPLVLAGRQCRDLPAVAGVRRPQCHHRERLDRGGLSVVDRDHAVDRSDAAVGTGPLCPGRFRAAAAGMTNSRQGGGLQHAGVLSLRLDPNRRQAG
jgi:hypothetical protein